MLWCIIDITYLWLLCGTMLDTGKVGDWLLPWLNFYWNQVYNLFVFVLTLMKNNQIAAFYCFIISARPARLYEVFFVQQLGY